MEDVIENWMFYTVIAFMLLGAFVIGYFFGGTKTKEITVAIENSEPSSTIENADSQETDSFDTPIPRRAPVQHIELDELSRPGPIRALKTRERSGSLSDDAKMSMAEEKLDFDSLGRADRFHKDDFQKITGIGPFIEEKLNSIGIYNYSQLSKMTDEDMDVITTLIDFFPGRIHRDDWKGQAIALIKKENQS